MTNGSMFKQYRRANIETAGKLDLIIICYEKAILCLNQAKNHFKEKEYEKKSRKIQKALDIINELQSCLNIEKGGVIAKNLDAIYSYITNRILVGDIQKDVSVFDECVNMLEELKGAWVEISRPKAEERIEAIGKHDPNLKERIMVAA
jgi:flagellar protein FliS